VIGQLIAWRRSQWSNSLLLGEWVSDWTADCKECEPVTERLSNRRRSHRLNSWVWGRAPVTASWWEEEPVLTVSCSEVWPVRASDRTADSWKEEPVTEQLMLREGTCDWKADCREDFSDDWWDKGLVAPVIRQLGWSGSWTKNLTGEAERRSQLWTS
jgi:hypothetical protein